MARTIGMRTVVEIGVQFSPAVGERRFFVPFANSFVGKSQGMALQDLTGTVLAGRYRLVRQLGRGGMGAVYEAVQENLGRAVAVKVILPELVEEAEVVARFRREAESAGSLRHPNIIQVTDFGHVPPEPPFFVMELLNGLSLRQWIQHNGPVAAVLLQSLALQVLSALDAAHRAGIVHRDLKPDNIFLVEMAGVGPIAKLLDFGIAKLTESRGFARLTATGVLVGTPAYMASEQLTGLAVDARTDVYALGVTMFRALTGRLPYERLALGDQLRAMLTGARPRAIDAAPGVDPGLSALIERAMALDPRERFQSAAEMAQALLAWRPGSATPKFQPSHSTESMTIADRMHTAGGPIGVPTQFGGPQPAPWPAQATRPAMPGPMPQTPSPWGPPPGSLGPPTHSPFAMPSPAASPSRVWPIIAAVACVVTLGAIGFGVMLAKRSSAGTAPFPSTYVPPDLVRLTSPGARHLIDSERLSLFVLEPRTIGARGVENVIPVRDALGTSLLGCFEAHSLIPVRTATVAITFFAMPGMPPHIASFVDGDHDAARAECMRAAGANINLPVNPGPGAAGTSFSFQVVPR